MARVRAVLTDDSRGGLRALGGLILATGVQVLLIRRMSFADPWGAFPVFLLLLITTVFLYGSGFLGARWKGRVLSWQAAYMVYGLLLIPATLAAFLDWIGGDLGSSLNLAWIFLLAAIAALAAARLAGLRYGALLGSLALIVSWLALWDGILSDGIDTVNRARWLLAAVSVGLLGLSVVASILGGRDGWRVDIITGAGVAAVGAGALAALILTFGGALIAPVGNAGLASVGFPVRQSAFWDIELLVVSLALIGYAAVARVRGPGYVGAFGLLVFIYSVGLDLDDSSPAGKVLGWPLILIVIGGLLYGASVLPALRREDA
ncbi:MAG: hypothetical protein ACJ75R_06265 [Solirubrobacterales bacterium]